MRLNMTGFFLFSFTFFNAPQLLVFFFSLNALATQTSQKWRLAWEWRPLEPRGNFVRALFPSLATGCVFLMEWTFWVVEPRNLGTHPIPNIVCVHTQQCRRGVVCLTCSSVDGKVSFNECCFLVLFLKNVFRVFSEDCLGVGLVIC